MDDDNYVNVRALLRLLASYPHTQDVYIGKPSLDRPIQATERVSETKTVSGLPTHTGHLGRRLRVPAAWRGSHHFPWPCSVPSTSGLPRAELASASAVGWP